MEMSYLSADTLWQQEHIYVCIIDLFGNINISMSVLFTSLTTWTYPCLYYLPLSGDGIDLYFEKWLMEIVIVSCTEHYPIFKKETWNQQLSRDVTETSTDWINKIGHNGLYYYTQSKFTQQTPNEVRSPLVSAV